MMGDIRRTFACVVSSTPRARVARLSGVRATCCYCRGKMMGGEAVFDIITGWKYNSSGIKYIRNWGKQRE